MPAVRQLAFKDGSRKFVWGSIRLTEQRHVLLAERKKHGCYLGEGLQLASIALDATNMGDRVGQGLLRRAFGLALLLLLVSFLWLGSHGRTHSRLERLSL